MWPLVSCLAPDPMLWNRLNSMEMKLPPSGYKNASALWNRLNSMEINRR